MGSASEFSLQALVIKLAIPALSAFAISSSWMALRRGRNPQGEASKGAGLQEAGIVLSMQTGAFFAALLMAWPLVVHWEVLSAPALAGQREAFLFIYLLYGVTYFFAAGAGAMLAMRMLARRSGEAAVAAPKHDWMKIGVEAFVSTLFGGVATFALRQVLSQ